MTLPDKLLVGTAHAEHERAMPSDAASAAQAERSFDQLAEAIGWTAARCEQTGDSPFDVAQQLVKDATKYRESLRLSS